MAEKNDPIETEQKDTAPKPIQLGGDEYAQDKLVTELLGMYDKWSTWRRPYETLWDEIYRLYMSLQSSQKTPTRAKVFVPVTFQVIENAVAKFIALLFNNEEFFEVVPTNPKDHPQAEVITKILVYQLGKANFFLKFIDFVKQLLLYGTSYFKIYWKVKRQWVWTREPIRAPITVFGFSLGMNRIVGWSEKKEYKVVERRPEIDVLDVMDVYPEPGSQKDQDGRGVFLRSYLSLDEIKSLGKGKYPVYSNTEDRRLTETDGQESLLNSRYATRGTSDAKYNGDKGKVEILEFWGCYDLDEDGIKEEVLITLANRTVLLRAVPNPFHHQKRPLVKAALFPVPMEWFGIGMVEPIIPLQHELNTLRSQRLHNINLSLNRMWKVNSLADVDVDTLVSSPNGIVLTDDMGAVEPLLTTDSTGGAFQESEIVKSDIENVTVPRSVQGIPESGRLGRTARGAQLIISQALEKFGLSAKLVEDAIKKVLRMMHQLNLQFIDSEDVARETGMNGSIFDTEVTPEMIRADVMFKMVGVSDMVGKEAKINQITSFMGLAKDILAPETLDTLLRKVWYLMGEDPDQIKLTILPNVDKSIVAGAEAPAGNQQIQAALQAQAQQNGSNTPPSIPGVRPS